MSLNVPPSQRLLVDRQIPRSISELSFHPSLSSLLERLGNAKDIPHLLMYGPAGAGKTTRVRCLLAALFGNGINKLRVESRTVSYGVSSSVDVQVLSSSFHLELTPSDVGNKDVHVLQSVRGESGEGRGGEGRARCLIQILKEVGQSGVLGSQKMKFKCVVIHDADALTRQAQASLRRTMEKYVSTCRVILVSESLSKLIPPLRSRCLCLRVPAPSEEEIASVLRGTSSLVGLPIGKGVAAKISKNCNRDLRRALLLLETVKKQNPMALKTEEEERAPNLPPLSWEGFCRGICEMMLSSQDPKTLIEIRGRLYELLGCCIPADAILRALVKNLVRMERRVEEEVIEAAAKFDHTSRTGSKEIFHLEAFCARVMSVLHEKRLR